MERARCSRRSFASSEDAWAAALLRDRTGSARADVGSFVDRILDMDVENAVGSWRFVTVFETEAVFFIVVVGHGIIILIFFSVVVFFIFT